MDMLFGPLLYLAAIALGERLLPSEVAGTSETLLVAGISVLAAIMGVFASQAIRPSIRAAATGALAGLLGTWALRHSFPAGHAALLLLAGIGFGELFAQWISPRMVDTSIIFTAAAAFALFDFWSVAFGPAHNASTGGWLSALLLEAPHGDGHWMRILGLSDLVIVALLARLVMLRNGSPVFTYLGSALAILAALGQAALTRQAAPALPWIGALFCLSHWSLVKPDAAGWRRTARWCGGAALALGLVTWLIRR